MTRRYVLGVVAASLLLVVMGIAEAAQDSGEVPAGRVKVLIGFDKKPGPAEQALVKGARGKIKYNYHLIPAIAATVPEAAIAGLRRNPRVTHIDPDGRIWALDTELDDSWGVKRIGSGAVHAYNKGTGVAVAVVDSGIDYTHPDLNANYRGGYDFVNDDDDPRDDNGHGTHVAGTIAAEDNGSGVVGVAPEAHLYALKVLDAGGEGYWSDLIAALQWSVDNNIQVVNMSLGGVASDTVQTACQAAYDAGLLLVASAGNEGRRPGKKDTIGDPADYDSVMAVAATDQDDVRAKWSSTGPQLELSAPGVGINSTLPGGGYGTKSGTSMASPHVAGVAALVFAAHSGWSNAEVRDRLKNTADDLGEPGWDSKYGEGLVDADEAALPPAATGSIAGTVTNASDSTGIGEATVSTDTGESAQTAADGAYVIADVPVGNRLVTAAATGFGPEAKAATVVENATTTVDFALTPSLVPTAVSVESVSYSAHGGRNKDKHLTVTVTVVDNLGNSFGGASVAVVVERDAGGSWTFSGTTEAGGAVAFSINNAPSGCYTTTVTSLNAGSLVWDWITPANNFCK